jgi:hypothetical protein
MLRKYCTWEKLCLYYKIGLILKCMSSETDAVIWTGFIHLGTGSSGGLRLYRRARIFWKLEINSYINNYSARLFKLL